MSGHVSWYANPLYVYALIRHSEKPIEAMRAEVLALLLALLFLAYKTVVMDFFVGHDHDIVGYGLGYWLWVLSIGTLFVGDLLVYKGKGQYFSDKTGKRVVVLTACAAIMIFSYEIFGALQTLQTELKISRERERETERVFEEKCRLAGEHIYGKPGKVKGVFVRNLAGCDTVCSDTNTWEREIVNRGFLKFTEIEHHSWNAAPHLNPISRKRYLRFKKGNTNGEGVDEMGSEYAVEGTNLSADVQHLNISGGEIRIIRNSTQEVLAKTTFFATTTLPRKCCGCDSSGRFSLEGFLIRVLELSPDDETVGR